MTTVAAQVAAARRRLVDAGIDGHDATIDVEVLARRVLDWTRAQYLSRAGDPAPPGFVDRLAALIDRRCRREPVALITGTREFWGLDIAVTSDVLIPRPETELLVETALSLLKDRSAPWHIADAGTGSGCLAVALARELTCARVTATDRSAPALEVARRNATRLGVSDRISFRETSWLDGVSGPFDLIVSNPPYVPTREMEGLAPELTRHEPASALCGGPDGLNPARALLSAVTSSLRPDGWFLMEIGLGQDAAVGGLVTRQPGLSLVEIRKDLQGIPRAVVIRRDPNSKRSMLASQAARSCSGRPADAGGCERPIDRLHDCSSTPCGTRPGHVPVPSRSWRPA